jgi:hypothetical protein
MENTTGRSAMDPARHLEGELRLLHEAILMVAAGGAPRVMVAGLRLARAVLPEAQVLAAGSGVRVVPLWTADEQQFDVCVERDTT